MNQEKILGPGASGPVALGMILGIQEFPGSTAHIPMFTQPTSCRFSGWAENVAEHRREHLGLERDLDADCCVNIAPFEASRSVFGQDQMLFAHSLRHIMSYFVFLPLGTGFHCSPKGCKGAAEVKGRERRGDADALWPQPVVQLENP